MKNVKCISKMLALLLALGIVFTTAVACAEEDPFVFFKTAISGHFEPVETREIPIGNHMVLRLPAYWEPSPDSDVSNHWLVYQGADETADCILLITWEYDLEYQYEQLLSELKDRGYTPYNVTKGDFQWQGFYIQEQQTILVLHKDSNSIAYAICLRYEGQEPAPDSPITRDFNCILTTFMPVNQAASL